MTGHEADLRIPRASRSRVRGVFPLVFCGVAFFGCTGVSTQDFLPDTSFDIPDVPGDTGIDGSDPSTETGCEYPLTECGGECVDIYTDILNCGGCGTECPGGENADPVCVSGTCATTCHEGFADLDGDGGCEYVCFPTSDVETCNGLDDECDGEIDEDFDCVSGALVPCTTTCGTTGEGFCGVDYILPPPESCVAPVEECNGLDDDCDTIADNGFACAAGTLVPCETSCGTTGEGRCHDDCTPPLPGECGIGVEVCNGLDDNCNGTVDEGYLCAMGAEVGCTTTCGSMGTGLCSASCTPPGPSECTPPSETCNGLDDDCNGTADDGPSMSCVMGASVSCTTTCGSTGTGTCSSACEMPTPSDCAVPAETCNGIDDDCDGPVDNGTGMDCALGTTGFSCTTGGGTAGTQDCTSSCTFGTCCAATETCGNSWDDNCDGTVDEGCCDPLDTCECAGVISTSGSWSGSNSSLVDDYHGGCGSTGGRDAVYQLTLSSSQFVHFDTNGSSYDTTLYVFSGSCSGTPLACDDDGGSSLQSLVELTLSAGTYYVVVDGYSSSSTGSYTLNVSGGSGSGGETCALAIPISAPGMATGDTSSAVNDYTVSGCSGGSGPDVVYELTLGSSQTLTIDTVGSSFDTVLHVRDSSCVTELTCNDDYSGLQSQVTYSFSAGTYYIIVDGYGTTSYGSYVLNVN